MFSKVSQYYLAEKRLILTKLSVNVHEYQHIVPLPLWPCYKVDGVGEGVFVQKRKIRKENSFSSLICHSCINANLSLSTAT